MRTDAHMQAYAYVYGICDSVIFDASLSLGITGAILEYFIQRRKHILGIWGIVQ